MEKNCELLFSARCCLREKSLETLCGLKSDSCWDGFVFFHYNKPKEFGLLKILSGFL
jgi:hypothetical protein